MVGSPIAGLAVRLAPEGMICMGPGGRRARLVSALPDGGEAAGCGCRGTSPAKILVSALRFLFLDGLVTVDLAAAVGPLARLRCDGQPDGGPLEGQRRWGWE